MSEPTKPGGETPVIETVEGPNIADEKEFIDSYNEAVTKPEIPRAIEAAEKFSELRPVIEGVKETIQTVAESAPVSRRTRWIASAIIAIAGSVAYPCGAAVSSYANKRAEMEQKRKNQEADALNQQRKMQADLLKRVIVVAEKASLKDPTSVFQLGLIAQMVNENERAFGIQLGEAEVAMRSMFDRLAPISGLRTRLAETDNILAQLQRDQKVAADNETRLEKEIREMKAEEKALSRDQQWYRERLKTQIRRKRQEIVKHRLGRRFYSERIKQEEHFKNYFQSALNQQSDLLRQALQDVVDARSKSKQKALELEQLARKLKQAPDEKQVWDAFWEKVQDLTKDYNKLQSSVEQLRAELKDEHKELELCRANFQAVLKSCRYLQYVPCQADTITPSSNLGAKAKLRPSGVVRRVTPMSVAPMSLPRPMTPAMSPPRPYRRIRVMTRKLDKLRD